MAERPRSPQGPLNARVQGALTPLAGGSPEQIPPLVDALLREAHAARVSDVHLVCTPEGLDALFRVDGDLLRVARLPEKVRELILQRLKVMAQLVVYQHREPQDGRIVTEIGETKMSLRVAFLPTLHGERAVIRFPDPARGTMGLEHLGMMDEVLERFRGQISRPQGAMLLTGPASSGKTTTIYAALRSLTGGDLNILTVEDPIEAEISGVSQTQIDPGVGLDFPFALRAAMRQDPNVLVVGEIRDSETASTGIQAALTGHLLIATVHAGTSAGVFTRLAHMGVERYLLATAITGVLNQRLARAVCPGCAKPWEVGDRLDLGEEIADAFGVEMRALAENPIMEGAGCDACSATGCRGRLGVFELLTVTPEIRQALLDRAPEGDIASLAIEAGQPTLRDDLCLRMFMGVISPGEALRLLG